jgi:hypothetical protein
MRSFLLCSFPGSGLLWLSRFFSVPHHSICLNGGLSRVTNAEDFWAMADDLCRAAGVDYFGNAEELNLVLLPALLARRPLTSPARRPVESGAVRRVHEQLGFAQRRREHPLRGAML